MGILCKCDICEKTSGNLAGFFAFKLRNCSTGTESSREYIICSECAASTFNLKNRPYNETAADIPDVDMAHDMSNSKKTDASEPNPNDTVEIDSPFTYAPSSLIGADEETFTPFIGMNLRKFLRTNWYTESLNNFIFVTTSGDEIMDISPYIRHHIVHIRRGDNEPNDIIVTMSESDYIPEEDENPDDIL